MADLQLTSDLFASPFRFLWYPATSTVILSDVHLGLDVTLIQQGLALPGMPATYVPALERAWQGVVARNPSHVIVNGDLFDTPDPPATAIDYCHRLFNGLPAACRITITPGNHDPAVEKLAAIFSRRLVVIREHVMLGDNLISHGHLPAPTDSTPLPRTWIVGHQHPAVTFRTRVHTAKMSCFVTCERQGKDAAPARLVITPSFSKGPLGTNLLNSAHWILAMPRPAEHTMRIAGLIEPTSPNEANQVLDFGTLSMLPHAP